MKLGVIGWQKFEKFLVSQGCVFVKQEGDHRKYHKQGILRPIIIPRIKDIPVFIIQNNLRVLGISREDYLEVIGIM